MKIRYLIYTLLTLAINLAACKKDNLEAPKSTLTGRVVYQGQALGVRSNTVQLQLWQSGFAFSAPITVYVDQDGSYSAALFDGDYKLVRTANAPWVASTDTINVKVSGNTVVDVPVQPHFIITSETFQKSGTASMTTTFNLQKINTAATLERVNLYLGTTTILDEVNKEATVQKTAAEVTNLSQPISLTASIPAAMVSKGYLYARVGVKAVGVNEVLYTLPVKISL
ncbi:DUF3823 domain-containing protein [Desertivirga arenae]|uniref:DUF3823 domain-containing protein n=1 Tax=Desertivirga arenae TaxID=2810309 RepID=UPI001A96B4AE|nr:DUF3823 domain-containing protein [Pedobacter sp. SYSU D00823]